MNRQAWLGRLGGQLPGWKVWYQGAPGSGWCAAPDLGGGTLADALHLADRIGPYATPQELRRMARQRHERTTS